MIDGSTGLAIAGAAVQTAYPICSILGRARARRAAEAIGEDLRRLFPPPARASADLKVLIARLD